MNASQEDIARAATLLRAGELVALPTETVYGLGADASNAQAVAKIFAAKGRPADHPLIVHLADADSLIHWAREIPKEAIALARAFWPGPLTLILKKEADVLDDVTGGQDTVGLRVPDHPVALALLRAFSSDGGGIAAPSANRFGRISPTTAQHVAEDLGDAVSMILDGGACQVGIESTILDLSRGEPVILRPGMIGADAIAAVIGRQPRLPQTVANAPRVSGALAAHYAPRTPMRMSSNIASASADSAVLAFSLGKPVDHQGTWIKASNKAASYAHDLYANLRALDACGATSIVVEEIPAASEWHAVRDRLGRAVTGSGAE
jgi:L-threonylcarbamoyladenylate synthase